MTALFCDLGERLSPPDFKPCLRLASDHHHLRDGGKSTIACLARRKALARKLSRLLTFPLLTPSVLGLARCETRLLHSVASRKPDERGPGKKQSRQKSSKKENADD